MNSDSFASVYKNLNERQREAVDTIDGPILVVAGPGTGKTQLLSARVANILSKTDTAAKNILCLTFTEKAALNMRERLGRFIGNDAHNVTIKTFHGFGSEIMNVYPDYFWNAARLVAAPDVVQLEVIESILRKLPHHNPLALRFAGNPTLTKDVRDALKYTKEAGLTPDKLSALVAHNIAYIDVIEPLLTDVLSARIGKKSLETIGAALAELPSQQIGDAIAPLQPLSEILLDSFVQAKTRVEETNKNTALSEWKKRWFQTKAGVGGMHEERKRNIWWSSLAQVYSEYRTILHTRGYYDYADMIIEVISQLEQSEDLRAAVQERYTYVLIDEFQDTNEAQMRLAHLVADHAVSEGNPNIMTVGDDDQAIYKFQGAELNNLLNFRRSYPKTKIIVLDQNYRSHPDVLALASQVIAQAEHRLVTHEKDIMKDIVAASEQRRGNIEHISYATQDDQYAAVAEHVNQAFSNLGQSVAVVARSNASLRNMASILHKRGIPVHYEQQNNVFDHPITIQALLLCRITQALLDADVDMVNALFARTLRHPMWNIQPETLWRLALAAKKDDWLSNIRVEPETAWIAQWFDNLATCASVEDISVFMGEILGLSETSKSPIKAHYVADQTVDSNYLSGLSAIRIVRGLITDFSRNGNTSLEDFLKFVSVYEENGIVLADESPFITAPNAVQLMTVYKAKGLEFDSVFVLDAVDTIWSPTKGNRKPPANLPLRPAGDDWDDYVRLMFVAITRAVSDVTITSFRTNTSGKEILPTPIISHVLPATEVPASLGEHAVAVLESSLTWPRLNSSNEQQLLAGTLQSFQLSATSLLQFLDLEKAGPSIFLERSLLRIPGLKTPFQSHGTAMHAALEHGQKLINAGSFSLDAVIEAYHQNLAIENLPKAELENWHAQGERALKFLFHDLGFRFEHGSSPERRFRDISCGNAVLSGAFDCTSTKDTAITIIDYKTGHPLTNISSTTKAEGVKAWRHRTQLIFYGLMAAHIPEYRDKKVQGSMIYVEAEEQKYLRKDYVPTPDDINRMEVLCNAVWNKIQNLDFPDISNYEQSLNGIRQFEGDLIRGSV